MCFEEEKLAVEFYWVGGGQMSGARGEADVLGIFCIRKEKEKKKTRKRRGGRRRDCPVNGGVGEEVCMGDVWGQSQQRA